MIMLTIQGYIVDCAVDGKDGVEKFDDSYNLVVIDVVMPRMSGIDACRKMRDISNVPILFLTAKSSEIDKIQGFDAGADDYIIKPFETIELLARVEVVLRRYNKNKQTIKFKNIEVDTEQRIVNLNNKEVYLTVKEYELLVLLLQNKNRALSRDQILERVWRFEYGGETRTVDIHIQRIREKLDLKNNIKTVFKVGYRLEE